MHTSGLFEPPCSDRCQIVRYSKVHQLQIKSLDLVKPEARIGKGFAIYSMILLRAKPESPVLTKSL